MCKFGIMYSTAFLFLNFKCNLMDFSEHTSMEIDTYNILIFILFKF
jgi:hypothetical protein